MLTDVNFIGGLRGIIRLVSCKGTVNRYRLIGILHIKLPLFCGCVHMNINTDGTLSRKIKGLTCLCLSHIHRNSYNTFLIHRMIFRIIFGPDTAIIHIEIRFIRFFRSVIYNRCRSVFGIGIVGIVGFLS